MTAPEPPQIPNGKLPGKKFIPGNLISAAQNLKELKSSKKNRKKKTKVIDELKIFDNELENQTEFDGFTDLFHSFDLYRGKVSYKLKLIRNILFFIKPNHSRVFILKIMVNILVTKYFSQNY
jgi:hypothetical protein